MKPARILGLAMLGLLCGAPTLAQESEPAPHSAPESEIPEPFATFGDTCQRVIEHVRTDRPSMPAPRVDPDDAMTVLAVDYAVDGCTMLVTRETGVQPVPLPPEDGLRMRPAQ